MVAALLYILCSFLFWAEAQDASQQLRAASGDIAGISSVTIKMKSILGGVVLYFEPSPDIKRTIDYFVVSRALVEHGQVASTATATRLDYYHDWYKDYFYQEDQGRTFAYRVDAYDSSGRVMGHSAPLWSVWKVQRLPRPGFVLTPTAYRQIPFYDSGAASGADALFPVNVDVTAAYYIGRLYSYNRLTELTNTRRGLFSRIGVMFWQLDAKTILEKEGRYFPQLAIGAEGSMMLNNAPAPQVTDAPGITLTTKEKNRTFNGLYLVASKDFGWLNPSLGWVRGTTPSKLIYLAEFLAKESEANAGVFGGLILRLGKRFALQGEFIRPVGSKAAPYLVNLQVGRALHTNFDVAYMRYDRVYEVMAHINFRYTLYPSLGKKK